jgi:uncharacterized membrane protein
MANAYIVLASNASPPQSNVRPIAAKDVKDALLRGVDDFLAMPTHVVFLSLIYPVVGIILAKVSFEQGLLYCRCCSHSQPVSR